MIKNCLLTEKLNSIIAWSIWRDKVPGTGDIFFKKRLWEMQAREMIIKEGLDWWFSDRMSRGDIFTTRF